jgi:hypothetical protein
MTASCKVNKMKLLFVLSFRCYSFFQTGSSNNVSVSYSSRDLYNNACNVTTATVAPKIQIKSEAAYLFLLFSTSFLESKFPFLQKHKDKHDANSNPLFTLSNFRADHRNDPRRISSPYKQVRIQNGRHTDEKSEQRTKQQSKEAKYSRHEQIIGKKVRNFINKTSEQNNPFQTSFSHRLRKLSASAQQHHQQEERLASNWQTQRSGAKTASDPVSKTKRMT